MHQFHHISASYANTKKIHKMFLPILFLYTCIDDLFFQDNVKKEETKLNIFVKQTHTHLIKL